MNIEIQRVVEQLTLNEIYFSKVKINFKWIVGGTLGTCEPGGTLEIVGSWGNQGGSG